MNQPTQAPPIVFLDTETTSLRPDRRAWEVGLILRRPGHTDRELCWLIDVADLDLANADTKSLDIGGFYQRHPQMYVDPAQLAGQRPDLIFRELPVAWRVEHLTRGAYIVGGVPGFDAEVLAAMLRRNGLAPSWHYHLTDFENLIVGYLRGCHKATRRAAVRWGQPAPDDPPGWPFHPPWRSEDLSRAIGVEPPGPHERHTAMGDARWAVRVWDEVMGDTVPLAPLPGTWATPQELAA